MKKPGVSLILKRIAPKIGATVHLEPEYGFVGYIAFKSGKKSFFRQSTFDINPLGATMIAKDKGYTSHFLRQFGYNTPQCLTIFSKERNDNLKTKRGVKEGLGFCNKIGFPVIVKPNDIVPDSITASYRAEPGNHRGKTHLSLQFQEDTCFIVGIGLEPRYRGAGLGEELYGIAEQIAQQCGCRRIVMHPSGEAITGKTRKEYTMKLGYVGIPGSFEVEKIL